MFITRRAEFSASHTCRIESLSDAQNFHLYGEESNRSGHGHNYTVEVTLEGEPDPVTGMVMDLKELKEILEREIVEPMDHRFLNFEGAAVRQSGAHNGQRCQRDLEKVKRRAARRVLYFGAGTAV